MDEHNFQRFQILLIRIYVYIKKVFGTKKDINQIELEFVSKYSKILRKINDFLINLSYK